MLLRAWPLLAIVFAGCACPAVFSATVTVAEGGYSIRAWETEDGLPQNTVTAITQTREGYLWIGTLGGLARFDGERFQVFDGVNSTNLEDGRIISLFEDASGVLWIGLDSGRITSYRDGKFYPAEAGRNFRSRVLAMGADEKGAVWLFRNDGSLVRADATDSGSAGETIVRLVLGFACSGHGKLWTAVEGVLSQLVDGKVVPVDLGPAHESGFVKGIGAAADGGVWVVRDGWICKWDGRRWGEDRRRCPRGVNSVSMLAEMPGGCLALGSIEEGIHLLFPDGRQFHFNHSNGLSQNWARCLYPDREGNLWVGVGTGGLAVLRSTPFSVLTPPDGWQGQTVLSVATGVDESLWIGTEGAGLYRYEREHWTHFGLEQGLRNLFIWGLAQGRYGQMLVGDWAGNIYRPEGDQLVQAAQLEVQGSPVLALHYVPDDDTLWIGTGKGLLRSKDGESGWSMRSPEGTGAYVCAIARDNRGGLWFGSSDGGLGRLEDGKITRFNQGDGLSSNSVQCLLSRGDTLWIGTRDGGLNRFKNGRFSSVGAKQGLVTDAICHLIADKFGFFWISTHHGILRVSSEELDRCADGKISAVSCQVYDRDDGLPTIEFSGGLQAAGCETAGERLWFASNRGLVGVDPARVQLNPHAPPVIIESFRVDGRAVNPSEAALLLQPDHQRLEFRYTGLSLAASNRVQFKYRMVGLDKNWIDAGRSRTAFYTHLPAGSYRFQVIACNNDGVWNEAGSSLGFIVPPFYWQTWWFRGLAGLVVLTSVGWIVRHETRRRMQRRVEELERERGIERERTRIAQDIHDDIGSRLTRITMLCQSVRSDVHQTPGVAGTVERIHDTAIEVTCALDEIVWAVNPQDDTLDSLACYMARIAQDVLSVANVGCRLDLPLDLPPTPLGTQIRHNLLLALKEALNNVIKHSGATEVQVSLALKEDAFEIAVKDNGRGFNPLADDASQNGRVSHGNGLGNLQQRLQKIGGRCEIATEVGKGSCITFIVALPRPSPSRRSPRFWHFNSRRLPNS